MTRVRAKWEVLPQPAPGIMAIVDTDEGMSITNDAEAVVEFLLKHAGLQAGDTLIYRDTEGTWDELVFGPKGFIDFRFLGAKDLEGALAIVNKRKAKQQ